jgi:hypothetical protein
MLVYVADKKQFLHDCEYEDIEDVIQTKFKEVTGKRVAQAEVKSWQSSLSYLAKVLRDDEIAQDIGVAVELHIPQSSKRIDVTLSGYDSGKKPSRATRMASSLLIWAKAKGKSFTPHTKLGRTQLCWKVLMKPCTAAA